MDALREIPNNSIDRAGGPLESGTVQIVFHEPEDIIPRVPNYPYNNSKIIDGTLTYTPDRLISGMPDDGDEFEISYRTGSNLLTIQGLGDEQRLREVISETSRSIDSISLRRIPYDRKSLSSFIFAGEYQPSITVRDYRDGELVEYEEMEGMSQEELVQEFRITDASVVFEHNNEEIHVIYRDDELSFVDGISEEGREYVIQLFEKYVIHGAVSERFE